MVWSDSVERGHGREENRSCKIVTLPRIRGFHTQQEIQIARRQRVRGADV